MNQKNIFSNLIFDGQIGDLSVGKNISCSELKLEKIVEEEGDIPSLFNLYIKNNFFQLTVLKGIVIGIMHDLEYEKDKLFDLEINNRKIKFGYNLSFNDFLLFIDKNKIKYNKIHYKDDNYVEIQIEKSGIILSFINSDYSKLYKVQNFDNELYEKLSNEIKSKKK